MTNEEAVKYLKGIIGDGSCAYVMTPISVEALKTLLEAVGKADKYRKIFCPYGVTIAQCQRDTDCVDCERTQRYRWHDLRKNPEDLPKEHKQYLMEYKYSDKENVYGTPIFIAEEKRWSDECSAPKLRWREIEVFEEEE